MSERDETISGRPEQTLEGFSELLRLGHSEQRLSELQGQISEVLATLARLDGPDVTDTDPAVIYTRPIDHEQER